MKILIVSSSDIIGGASRAAHRLHRSLLEEDIDSKMLVQSKSSDEYTIIGPVSKIQKGIGEIRPTLDLSINKLYKHRSPTYFSASWLPFSNIIKQINDINPDIVHLHWICGGMMRIEDLAKIKAPIVWSLHDMWAFTGGCHYDETCEGYKNSCGNCKVLGSHKQNDLSAKIYKRKEMTYSKINNITIVGLSSWLNDCSKSSPLLLDKRHVQLPNPIDTSIYKPLDKQTARGIWNLPKNKKLILFGALGGTSDPRKGFSELYESIQYLKNPDTELIIFGSSTPQKSQNFKFKTHYLGHINDDISLSTLYSAVDVMVVPSLREAFGQTASEAMSCGTPTVAFDHTGLLDIIDHKKTGYLAESYNSKALSDGIKWILDNPNYSKLCQNAREKVLHKFDSKIVSKKYINLYYEIINESTKKIPHEN